MKLVVKHAPEGDETNLQYLTEILNIIWNSEGRLKTHKEGMGKLLWKKEGVVNTSNIRPLATELDWETG